MAGAKYSIAHDFAASGSQQRAEPDGSQYGYQSRKPRPTTTAVALLLRMYTVGSVTTRPWSKGVAHLDAWGAVEDTLYYDYYATQVLFHLAGPEWDTWNRKMREYLISSQERVGHQAGSWYFEASRAPPAADSTTRRWRR